MPSPSDFEYVGPVGMHGTLSPSDSEPVDPYGMLSPSDSDPVGPYGTLYLSDIESDGPVGPVGRLSPLDHGDRLHLVAFPVGEMSSLDPAPVIWTDEMTSKDPVISRFPADGSAGDDRDIVDMDITVKNCPGAPDVSDSRDVVPMVGLDPVQRGEETPMECDAQGAEWDFYNERQSMACLYIIQIMGTDCIWLLFLLVRCHRWILLQ